MTDFLVQDMRPYRTVDTPWFKRMVRALDPRYTIPSRKQFSQVFIPKKYEEVKQVVKAQLQKAEQVALTTDGWTSRATESYITVTSTHIDVNWEMVNYVLMTRCMPESHTGQNIADFLTAAIREWEIPEKPVYLVSDNASNMTKAATLLHVDLHLGCFAHTLNLAAQKGLHVKAVSNMLARIRKIVGFFHRSTVAATLLQVNATNLDLPNHKLVIDVSTRWNSAYEMLDRYLEMQVAIVASLLSKDLKNKDKDLKFLHDEEITLATQVMETMKPLKKATTMLCSEKNPTISIILPLYNKLLDVYLHRNENDLPAVASVKAAIAENLKGRYDQVTGTLLKATVLDPRFKALPHLTEQERFDVYNGLVIELSDHQPRVIKTEPGSSQLESRYSDPVLPNLPCLPSLNGSENPDIDPVPKKKIKLEKPDVLSDLLGDVFVTKVENLVTPLQQADTEVQRYKELQPIPLRSDALAWWKENQCRFPLLSALAKKLLCIPSTSVPSERVFSTAGDIVSSQRASLKPKCVDLLIFLKKNMKVS